MITDDMFSALKRKVKGYMSPARWQHTLGVADAATKIGEILLPEKLDILRAAAILHDVAKELPYDEQYELIREFGIEASGEDLATRPALHSFSGVALIKRDFPDFATEEILSAVQKHTLGDPGMSLTDMVIFISDYIEEGRRVDSCKTVRKFIFDNLVIGCPELNERIVHQAMVMALDYTADYLRSQNHPINSRSFDTKMSLLTLI